MKYKAVIFDLDGVICSTDEYHFKAWKALANSLGIYDFTEEDNVKQRGVSRMESLEVVLAKSNRNFSAEEKVRLADEKNELYKKMLDHMSPADLSGEVKNTLDKLRAGGVKLAIGSSSKNTPLILERLGLTDFFDAVSDGNNITKSKPDPEVFLKAARFLGENPSDCLVVEDALSGVEAGKRGGFDTAAIGYAAGTDCATYRLKTFSDLSAYVLGVQ